MNQTTAALALLLVVLVVAALSSRRVAVVVSLVAFVSFNYFFLSPVGTLRIANRDDLIALFALLAVALIGSHLSQQARLRAQEAVASAQQRNAAEMARHSAEVKSALIASLSHGVKSPLTALTVAVENLASTEVPDEDRLEQLQIVRGELRRLSHLFENVIDMAGVDSDAIAVEREWVLTSELIDAARHRAADRLGGRAVAIEDATEGQLVQLDPRMTSAALAHVLENAAVYAPPPAAIIVAARVSAGRLVIDVRDQGPGLGSGDLERLFDRGYRGGVAKDGQFAGGMGLPIARGLLSLQGGRISAANLPAGGAVFTLDIPVATRPAASDAAGAA